MALPQYGSGEDIAILAGYLKSKPTGATVTEARKTLGDAVMDGRKLAALQELNLIKEVGDRLTLTPTGRDIARDPKALPGVVRDALGQIPAYRHALEWAHYQKFPALDTNELGAWWHENYKTDLGTDKASGIGRACACFFRFADAAGLGTYVVGRNKSPTRIELDSDALAAFVEGGPSTPPWASDEGEPEENTPLEEEGDSDEFEEHGEESSDEAETPEVVVPPVKAVRVFIAHGKNMELVEQVSQLLELAEIAYEVAEEEETAAIPVPEKVLGAMRRCTAGVVIVSVDDEAATKHTVNQNVLIEIGAAFVLYDQRVVLVWDKRLDVPSNLQGLYRCEFEGAELGWNSGLKMMKAIQKFKV